MHFEIMMEDFDEGIPSPYDGETDADVLEYVSSFFGITQQINQMVLLHLIMMKIQILLYLIQHGILLLIHGLLI